MDPPIQLGRSDAEATLADGQWTLVADRAHIGALSGAAAARDPHAGRRWVVTDPTDADDYAAAKAGLPLWRDVLQLRRPLPVEADVVAAYPGTDVRAFRPGTEDEEAWIACNNRAFASHPDQAGFTPERLHRLMREPWFDPEGFLLHEERGALVAFCWTKVHRHEQPRLGEIFVIGVDPAIGGRGMGGALTLAGLGWLAGRGLTVGILYVDADNAPARRLYQRLGFTLHHTDRVYASASSDPRTSGEH